MFAIYRSAISIRAWIDLSRLGYIWTPYISMNHTWNMFTLPTNRLQNLDVVCKYLPGYSSSNLDGVATLYWNSWMSD